MSHLNDSDPVTLRMPDIHTRVTLILPPPPSDALAALARQLELKAALACCDARAAEIAERIISEGARMWDPAELEVDRMFAELEEELASRAELPCPGPRL